MFEPAPSPQVIAIYRARNAERLSRVLTAGASGSRPWGLWALDEVAPSLAAWTVGQGPGGKFDLLNKILHLMPSTDHLPLVVTDDDIDLRRGTLTGLCALMATAGLDLAQPAHARRSQSSYEFNRRRRGSRARLTTFVEIGPVFAMAPAWRAAFAPFPADLGMGWGLELLWARQREHGCRLGVVDAVTVHHPDYPTLGYAQEVEEARAQTLMQEAGVSTMREAQQVLGTWWPWQPQPSWLGDDPRERRWTE